MRNFLLFAIISGALLNSCTLDPECEWTDLYADFESYEFTTDLEQTNIVLLTPEFDQILSCLSRTSFVQIALMMHSPSFRVMKNAPTAYILKSILTNTR